MKDDLEHNPPYSSAWAFVVQFRRETGVDTGSLVGRVEHVVSGQVARFQSLDELVAFMTNVLRTVAETTRRTS
jgi:hypothetical protein